MLAFLNTPTFPVFSPPTYFNPAFILRFYHSFIFYLAFIYCVLLFTNIIYHVMRTDTCNKPHTLRDAVTGRNRNVIQTYKIMNNIDRIDGKKFFKPCKEVRTRGHSKRVEKTQCKILVRRNTFSQRMANDWNALPDVVVMSGSINQFKGRLGRWWKNDPILYQNIRSLQVTKHSAVAIYNAREGHQPW